ncbi:alpha/beta fold hydrolase [Ureibacillus xyleni]|uniref:alpha/beta fold hydrolase n=1 Tax=Ureibacillus xyleni TaxID=614648 RepID=UPI00137A3B22|nr:alpha/beta hydrolase [Ureibacillus xyleni]
MGIFLYHSISSYERLPFVGEMIDIGDYQLHMYATGNKSTLPTIVLESGSGTPSSFSDWQYIQPELSKITRVISYDRAGYGWSEGANNDRTAEQIVQDLHKMLEVSGEKGPYILVGHSFGGFTMQLFAHDYPKEVVGIVLLDSSIIDKGPKVTDSSVFIQGTLRKVGVMRILGEIGALPVPEAVMTSEISREFLYRNFYNADQQSELKLMETTEEQLIPVHNQGLGTIPISILSSRAEEKEHKDWQALQDNLLQLSTNSNRLIVENSSHYIHHDQPEIVIDSILDMLNETTN